MSDKPLNGAIDLHCHSGPSVMNRSVDHIAAMQDASRAGMRAVLFKDHYYPTAAIARLLNDHFSDLGVLAMGSIVLNNTAGDFNLFALEHELHLGAKIVWMPTVSAMNHIRHGYRRNLLPTTYEMMRPLGKTVIDARGDLRDEVKAVLDLVARFDAVLAAGHLHISEIFALFNEAARRGVERRVVNHPTYTIDATLEDIRDLVSAGTYIEHSACMFINCRSNEMTGYPPELLRDCIDAAGIERTLIGSDLGQHYNPRPAEGMRQISELCSELGYSTDQVRRLLGGTAAELVGLS